MSEPRLRTIVIGVAIRDERILAIEGFDSRKGERFYRPPGGGIEFGERSEAALRREWREEIETEVQTEYLGALENVFTYEGRPEHEIILVHRVELADDERFRADTVAGAESDGTPYTARWLPLDEVRSGGAILYPTGLLELLDRTRPTFPDATLATERLVLRPYRAEDAPDVALACRDALTQRWLPLPNPYTDADALTWCTQISHRFRISGEGIEWAAIRRADRRLIGSFGLKRTDWRGRSSEIGYWVAPWARGEGLAVEAVECIGRWLLLEQGFERMVLRAATGNSASQRVAEKAGFTREGVARSAGFTNAGRVDLVVHSLIPADCRANLEANEMADDE